MIPRVLCSFSFAVTIAAILVVRHVRQEFQFIVVSGGSMAPTLRHGDLVVGRRRFVAVSRGDVVVFAVRPSDYGENRITVTSGRRVKRVVAVAGDHAPTSLPEALRQRHDGIVPAGHMSLAGDARVSEGSTEFGYIDVQRVESVVIRRLWKRGPQAMTNGPGRLVNRAALASVQL